MKATHHTIISIILAIFLTFFNPLHGLGASLFSDDMYAKSLMKDSYIDLQLASILENDSEFEEEMPNDGLSGCLYLTIKNRYDIVFFVLCKKSVSEKQISFFEKTTRAPPSFGFPHNHSALRAISCQYYHSFLTPLLG